MTWNPFKFQYTVTFLQEEDGHAILQLQKGTQLELIRFPKSLLPLEATVGLTFTLKLEDLETSKSTETKTMQKLLEELIR